jgi:hypothetical protein
MKKIINTFILGGLGVIFLFDSVVYVIGDDTISEQITGWINNGNGHIFWGLVAILCTHFVYGKYKD